MPATSTHPSFIRREKTVCKARGPGWGRRMGVPGGTYSLFLSTPPTQGWGGVNARRLGIGSGCSLCHTENGRQAKSEDQGTEAPLGEGKLGRTPPVHSMPLHTYASWRTVDWALHTETREGKSGKKKLSGRSTGATPVAFSRSLRFLSRRKTTYPELPRAGLQHAGLRNPSQAPALSRFRHVYCGHE